MKKRTLYIIIGIILIIIIAAVSAYLISANDYVASVAGEKITKAEYKFVLNNYKMQIESYQEFANENARKEFWKSKLTGNETAEEIVRKNTLDFLKEMKIQIVMAKANNISLDSDDIKNVKTYVDSMVTEQYAGKKRDAEIGTKEAYGITLKEFELVYRSLMLAQKFSSTEMEKVQPNADEIKKYYDDNIINFDKVTVTHILFTTVDETGNPLAEDKQAESKKKADDLFATLKSTDDFKALAVKHSQDPGVTENQGEYSFTYSESYATEFKEWAFKAKVGEIGIVKTDFGYHIMKLDKRTTFSEIDPETIKAYIQQDKFNLLLEEWKKDAKYNVITKPQKINSIKII